MSNEKLARRGNNMATLQKNLQDYGIIGDLHTAALVGMDGSIDWYCYPYFDSPSVFGAVLDSRRGGYFRIRASFEATPKQLYLPDTNVLITRFLNREGVGEVTDFMPTRSRKVGERSARIIRRITAVRGEVTFELRCQPAFDYARAPHTIDLQEEGAVFRSHTVSLALTGMVPLEEENGRVNATFSLREGRTTTMCLQADEQSDPHSVLRAMNESEVERTLRATVDFWRHWLSRSQYRGRWDGMVNRSALVLKLLTFQPSGAIIAAPTTSLPEVVGGERNWDYRYSWMRDAAFTVYALLRIGFKEEANGFMGWLMERISGNGRSGYLRPVYRVNGHHVAREEVLSHLEGYKMSRPVRIGNAASEQIQLDIYGALMDAVYLFNKHASPISYDLWSDLRAMLNWVCEHWKEADSGIWEMRSKPQHFVYSKMMCWVALDRGIRLAEKRGFPSDLDVWRRNRDAIYEEIMSKGWDEERESFVQTYESKALDASALLMPLVFFVSPTDPRMLKTLEAIQRELTSDHLVRRYSVKRSDDGLYGEEGTFSLCTFWLVEALTRCGRLEDARVVFEKMIGYANHLGLYSEEIGPRGNALGNFPQAFTHLALISAAVNLDKALGTAE
jgi:GH15 family glucan-1,4-alpha-glucosidase